jgi:hypothetical protein
MKETRFKSEIAQLELSDLISGEGGIRTHGGSRPTTVFETAPFGRSGTSPGDVSGVCVSGVTLRLAGRIIA